MNAIEWIAKTALAGRARWIVIAIALVGPAPVAYAHRVHVAPWLPYLMLLACPLMHVFMMRGHGGHASSDEVPSEIPKLPPANFDDRDV